MITSKPYRNNVPQMEADKLKRLSVGGGRTKVVALGIGSGVNVNELNSIASPPTYDNVLLVHDFGNLTSVEDQLKDTSCSGRYSSLKA